MGASVADEPSSFEHLLDRERDAIARFIELLRQEQTSLRHGKPDHLLELAEQKDKIALELSHISRQRGALLERQELANDRQGVETWCAKHAQSSTARATWSSILELAGEARELQRINGDLIALHLDYTTRALEVLSGREKALDLYGPDGQSSKLADQRIDHKA